MFVQRRRKHPSTLLGYCPHTVTVYNNIGQLTIKVRIYIYKVNIIQLLLSGGSTQHTTLEPDNAFLLFELLFPPYARQGFQGLGLRDFTCNGIDLGLVV